MDSSLYSIVIALAVVAAIVGFCAVAKNRWIVALEYFGAAVFLYGVALNIAALRHIDASGDVHSWATLPGWAYSTPVGIGAGMLASAGIWKLVSFRKNRSGSAGLPSGDGSKSPSQPSRV